MNPGWRFYRGDLEIRNFDAIHQSRFDSAEWMKAGNHGVSKPAYPDQEWVEVDLPHDFVIENEFSPEANQVHGSLPVSVGWYRKVFELPESDKDKRITLEFDGIYRDCSIWLNGHFVGRELSGYQSFTFDISEICHYGELNALAIRVDAREFELWSYEGGGIYRDVRLVKTSPVHVAYDGTCVRFEVEHTSKPANAHGTLLTTVVNDGLEKVEAEVLSVVYGPDTAAVTEISERLNVEAFSSCELEQAVVLENPMLWSPDRPNLYLLKTEIRINGEVVDVYETSFGIRSVRFDPKKGFSINGEPMKLKGVCNHQDHAGVGIAIPDRLQEWRIEQLKAMGCNALRTSHNQPTPALLDICDRLGIMVMDEARMPGTTPELMGQMEKLIRRDRNHPSIILWSLGNEEMAIQENVTGVRILQRMQERAHQLDPTRLCTYSANCDFNEIADNFEQHGFRVDVFGANYTSRRNDQDQLYCEGERYDEFHEKYPDWPLIGSETGGSGATRGLYGMEYYNGEPHLPDSEAMGIDDYQDLNPEREGNSTAYNETMTPWGRSIEDTWKDCADREFLGGTFLWTGFDYRGETYPFGWPAVVTRYGIMDLCGFPKDVFYYHQAWWTDQPMLHIFPHWNWSGKEGQNIDVWCYSNCAEVELLLNGESLGRQLMPQNGKLTWAVPYSPGEVRALGYDTEGKNILEKSICTTGAPASIRLTADRDVLASDSKDLSVIQVEILDEQGQPVPDADQLVEFEFDSGVRLLGVGNGNPVSHEPDQEPRRKLYHGLAQVLVGAGKEAGAFKVKATSDGLQSAELTLTLQEPENAPAVIYATSVGRELESDSGKNSIDGAL